MIEKSREEEDYMERFLKEFVIFIKNFNLLKLYSVNKVSEISKRISESSNLDEHLISKCLNLLIKINLFLPRIELIDKSGIKIPLDQLDMQTSYVNPDQYYIKLSDLYSSTHVPKNEFIKYLQDFYQNIDSEGIRISCLSIISQVDITKKEFFEFFEYAAVSDSSSNVQNAAKRIILTNYSVKGIKLFNHLLENYEVYSLPALYKMIVLHMEDIQNDVLPDYKKILSKISERYYNEYKKDIREYSFIF